jgi:hypothetical protein
VPFEAIQAKRPSIPLFGGLQQARGLAEKALKIDYEADTHRMLNPALKTAGLNALVREN